MTLPQNGKKLTEKEAERMEALADMLVSKLKNTSETPIPWRRGSALEE